MTPTLVILIALGALLAVVMQFVKRAKSAPEAEPVRYPFESCRPLTQREQDFYWRLRNALPEHVVLTRVALPRILRVEKGHDLRGWLERVNVMSVDFLVCRQDAAIVAAIDLEETPRDVFNPEDVDAKKAKALRSAGIKLLRLRVLPDEAELRKALEG